MRHNLILCFSEENVSGESVGTRRHAAALGAPPAAPPPRGVRLGGAGDPRVVALLVGPGLLVRRRVPAVPRVPRHEALHRQRLVQDARAAGTTINGYVTYEGTCLVRV